MKKIRDEQPNLIAYVRLYDSDVLDTIDELGKGDFVTISGFSMLRIARGVDEESGEDITRLFIKAQEYSSFAQSQ